MTQHSPEPWKLETGNVNDDVWVDITSADNARVLFGYPDDNLPSLDTLKRIAACVNACAGIPTECLADPNHWFTKALRKVADSLTEQELRKQPPTERPYSVANGVVVEKVIAEDGSLADVKVAFSEEKTMTQPRCDLCRFWELDGPADDTRGLTTDDKIGWCHRYPPEKADDGEPENLSSFCYDWCGEFQPTPKPLPPIVDGQPMPAEYHQPAPSPFQGVLKKIRDTELPDSP